jgi:hypothetical protein
VKVQLLDGATAATLAQVLPVLLLTLAVEVRRNELHLALSHWLMGTFFIAFGAIETILVLSIDGEIFPFQPFDAASALIIFGLMAILFKLSLADGPERKDALGG